MNPKELIRDPSRVHACLRELEDDRLVTSKACAIYIPVRFAARGLAEIGAETYICGIYAIVVEGLYYGVSLTNAMIRIKPTATMKVMIDGDEYYEFSFEPGSTVIANLNLVKTDILVYRIFDEMYSKGRIPWYIGYRELGQLFNSAKEYADANLGSNHEVMEMLASLVSRDPENLSLYYRQTVKDYAQMESRPPAFIPLRSIQFAATNTTNKLAGSYFSTGIVSSLNTPTDRVERIEKLLRK